MNTLQLVVLAGGFFIVAVSLIFAFGDDSGRQIVRRAGRLSGRLNQVVSSDELQLRRDIGGSGTLDRLVHRLTPQPDALRFRLQRTGRDIDLGVYGLVCLLVAALAFGAALFAHLTPLLALPLALLAGLWLPHMVVGFLAARRMKRFANLLPDAIGLMVRSIKAGLPITEAFQIIGREVPDPVGGEFRQISDQVRLGQPIEQALLEAAKRSGVAELKFLVVTLAIQRETGGNLAETLENLDNILRRRRQMRLKVRALSSEARASAMIIGSLPFIMMAVLSVADSNYLSVLFTDHLGNMLLGGGSGAMMMGVTVMWKMVRFEI
jgi:tight adherence protein B